MNRLLIGGLLFFLAVFFPVTEVIPAPDVDEVMIRDHFTDNGEVPSVRDPGTTEGWEEFWNSPDILIHPDKIFPGIVNHAKVTVWNVAQYEVKDVNVDLYYSEAGLGSPYPSLWSTLAGGAVISSIPVGGSREIEIGWIPPLPRDEVSSAPAYFIGIIASTDLDKQWSSWAQWDNNVAMRAFGKTSLPPEEDPRGIFDFTVGNPLTTRGTVAVWLNRDEIPQDWSVNITMDEGTFYPIDPEAEMQVKLRVVPPPDAKIGERLAIEVSEVLILDGKAGRSVGMGQGMTVEVEVHNITIDLEEETDLESAPILPDTLNVMGHLTNWTGQRDTIDYWIQAYDPYGNEIPSSPVLFATDQVIPPYLDFYHLFQHRLPDVLDPGIYVYRGRLGTYPDIIEDDAYINFEIFPE